MKRFGAILFWVGVMLCIVSIAVAAFAGFRAADAIQTAIDEAVPMPGGSSTLQLDEGDERTIYEQSQSGIPSARCSATGPGDAAVPINRTSDQSGTLGDVTYTNVGSITAGEPGTYTVTCTGAITLIGPSLNIEAVGTGIVGVVGGILGGVLGGSLAIVGVILWFIGRSRAKAAAQSYGNSPPPGTYSGSPFPAGTYQGSPPPPPGSSGGADPPAAGTPESGPTHTGGSYPPPPPPPGS
ncbi:MAG: hypothetical protein WBG57_08160 [Ornithinimicrobium sp.]